MNGLTSRWFTAAATAAALCVSAAAAAQDRGSPLDVLDRIFSRGQTSTKPQTTGQDLNQAPQTELVLRIERLEAQIRQMTGTIEQLQFRNRQLEAQIRGMGAIPGAQGGTSSVAPPVAPSQPVRPMLQAGVSPSSPPSSAAPERTSGGRSPDVFDPSQHPNAPGVPRPLGNPSAAPPAVVTAEPPIGAPGGRGAGAPLDLSTLATGIEASANPGSGQPPAPQQQPVASDPAMQRSTSPSYVAPRTVSPSSPGPGLLPAPPARNPNATGALAAVAPPSTSPKDQYNLAYGYVLRKDYALAEDTFKSFLNKFPNDRRAPDAQFWLGESLFQRQNFDAAAAAFLDLSTKHAGHTKAPDSLLRLAQSLAAMKQKEMACATLAEIGRKYPRASRSVKQGVEREQKRVHC
jgi:tol-pal system protein YbgF